MNRFLTYTNNLWNTEKLHRIKDNHHLIRYRTSGIPGVNLVPLSWWQPKHVLSQFFFLVVLGFEHRTLNLQGRPSTIWATPSAIFALIIWEVGLASCSAWTSILLFYFTFLNIAGMTGMHHHAQFFPLE
jgi:hypothetical protein